MNNLYHKTNGIKHFLIIIFLVSCSFFSFAQKVAVIGFNFDSDDGFTLLALEDLPSTEKIFITDSEYKPATNTIDGSGSTNESTVRITWSGTWNKGTIIQVRETTGSTIVVTSSTNGPSSPASQNVYSGDNFSLSNETFIAFSSNNTSDPNNNITEIHATTTFDDPTNNPATDEDCPCSANHVFVNLSDNSADFGEFKPSLRPNNITNADIINAANWNTGTTNVSLNMTEFTGTIVLPVELISFQVTNQLGVAQLNWATASETNNAGFEIEKSADGYSFEKIGWVEGQGTSQETQSYKFVDNNPFEDISYYRLKQIDFDEIFEYSEIAEIQIESFDNKIIQTFPNPVQDKLTISNIINVENIIIYNHLGQSIKQLAIDNKQQMNFDVDDLQKGIYILQLQKSNGTIITKQFVKQ